MTPLKTTKPAIAQCQLLEHEDENVQFIPINYFIQTGIHFSRAHALALRCAWKHVKQVQMITFISKNHYLIFMPVLDITNTKVKYLHHILPYFLIQEKITSKIAVIFFWHKQLFNLLKITWFHQSSKKLGKNLFSLWSTKYRPS